MPKQRVFTVSFTEDFKVGRICSKYFDWSPLIAREHGTYIRRCASLLKELPHCFRLRLQEGMVLFENAQEHFSSYLRVREWNDFKYSYGPEIKIVIDGYDDGDGDDDDDYQESGVGTKTLSETFDKLYVILRDADRIHPQRESSNYWLAAAACGKYADRVLEMCYLYNMLVSDVLEGYLPPLLIDVRIRLNVEELTYQKNAISSRIFPP